VTKVITPSGSILIQVTYKNQGQGDSGPLTLSFNFVDQSSGGSRQVPPLGAGQTAVFGGDPNDQSTWINCETGKLIVTITQNPGAPVPEVNTANNSLTVDMAPDTGPSCYPY
jgi:hypothetical protein